MAMAYRDPNGDVVKKFLSDNKVRSGWKNLISGDDDVKYYLRQIILDLGLLKGERNWPYAPKSHQILRAFALCEPENVKVIIVGTSPITGEGVANGLAFSSNRMEYEFTKKQAIFKVHKVLKEAGILDKQYYYDCGHEEWARNGVLLLNAALTIPLDDDSALNIQIHCKIWKKFLAKLLGKWIANTRFRQTIYVMLWGHEGKLRNGRRVKNYAKELWDGIPNVVRSNFQVRHAHHPTFPKEDNMYEDEAKEHFIEVASVYSDIFHITPPANT